MGGIVTKVRDGKSQQGTMVISDKALECNSRDRDVGQNGAWGKKQSTQKKEWWKMKGKHWFNGIFFVPCTQVQ